MNTIEIPIRAANALLLQLELEAALGHRNFALQVGDIARIDLDDAPSDEVVGLVRATIAGHDANKLHPDQDAAANRAQRKADLMASLADDQRWIRSLPVELNGTGIQRLANTLADLIEFIT